MKKFVLATATAAAVFAFGPMAVSAVPYGPGDESITLSDTTPAPGSDIEVNLFGFDPNEDIEIDVSGDGGGGAGESFRAPRAVVGTVTADDEGGATFTVVAPETPGDYVVTATGLESGASAQATFTVAGSTEPTVPGGGGGGGGGLPATGSDSNQLVQTGAIVVALGAGLVGVAALRRRRTVTA